MSVLSSDLESDHAFEHQAVELAAVLDVGGGIPKYFWFTYSAFVSTFGVMNQPPPTCQRLAPTSPVMPASAPCALL